MAVPAYLRQQTKAKFITVATRLAAWTLKWCKDERLFTRRERWIVTGDLWAAAKGVLACAKKANLRRDFTDAAQFAEREAYLRQAIDQLMEMEILLTIKYEMILQGFNAAKQAAPQPEKPPAEEPTGKKAHRGGRKRLTMDDIDRIFEIFFTMTAEEKDLIRGLRDSDKERRAAAP